MDESSLRKIFCGQMFLSDESSLRKIICRFLLIIDGKYLSKSFIGQKFLSVVDEKLFGQKFF